jgi:hypothetical protein
MIILKTLKRFGPRWLLDGIDITALFVRYRKRTIDLAENKENLTDNRVLSLRNVFVVTQHQQLSSFHRFATEYFKSVQKELKRKEGWESLPFVTRSWCAQLDEIISSNNNSSLRSLRRHIDSFETADNEDDDNVDENSVIYTFFSILNALVLRFEYWSDDLSLETAFIDQHLSLFIQSIFHSESINMRLGETHICNNVALPLADYVGSYKTSTGCSYDVLAVEVKPVSKTSNSQLEFDYVKVGKEMKEILDVLLDNGVQSPTVGGILVEGYTMTAYSRLSILDYTEFGNLAQLETPFL